MGTFYTLSNTSPDGIHVLILVLASETSKNNHRTTNPQNNPNNRPSNRPNRVWRHYSTFSTDVHVSSHAFPLALLACLFLLLVTSFKNIQVWLDWQRRKTISLLHLFVEEFACTLMKIYHCYICWAPYSLFSHVEPSFCFPHDFLLLRNAS